ncbi:MAG: biotin/lipoyl-binding protein [Tepidisphaerales bacterium]
MIFDWSHPRPVECQIENRKWKIENGYSRPTFSESWYRVADLKIRLRASAQISRQFYRGERWYVVRDPAGNQFHRLSSPAYQFVGLLDGTRTVSEAWELVGGQMADDAPTQNEVIQILSQLSAANLIEANVTPDAAVLLNRYKKFQMQRIQSRLMNILFPRIPLWDCDTFLTRWMPVMKHVIGPVGGIIWLLVVGAAVLAIAPQWASLKSSAAGAIDPQNWPFLWATFVLIKIIHELGHAFICRRFGGEVHELGVMFLVLMPAPYVDASTAWAFRSRWPRILVGAGGMIFELFVAAIMAFVWLRTDPSSIWHGLAYNAMLIASVSTVIFNANPLLRYDGYYMLADWLEIPNLRYRSTEYTMGLVKRHLFRVKLPNPLPPIPQRIWLFVYAIASSLYRTFIGIAIIFMIWGKVPILGVLMALGGIATWAIVPVVKMLKYLLIDPELHRKRARAVACTVVALTAVVMLVTALKVQTHVETQGITEPLDKKLVYAGASGTVVSIEKRDGDTVNQGDVILRCEDHQLDSELKQRIAELRGLQAQLEGNYADPNAQLRVKQQMEAVAKDIARIEHERSELVVRAPISGSLIAPDIRHWIGKYVKNGDEIGTVAVSGDLRIVACFDQSDAAMPYLHPNGKAEVRLAGDIEDVLWARVDQRDPTPQMTLPHPALGQHGGGPAEIDPTDQKGTKLTKPQIQFWLTLDKASDPKYVPGTIVPGQRAYLRFEMDRQPLIVNWSRRLWQTIQTYSNSKWM